MFLVILQRRDPYRISIVASSYSEWALNLARAAGAEDEEAVRNNFCCEDRCRETFFAIAGAGWNRYGFIQDHREAQMEEILGSSGDSKGVGRGGALLSASGLRSADSAIAGSDTAKQWRMS